MPACRLAPEATYCTSATPTTSRLCTHASRCRAGKYSNVTGVSACVNCGAGERCMLLARHMRPLTQASLCAYSGAACSTRKYIGSGKYISIYICTYIYMLYSCFTPVLLIYIYVYIYVLYVFICIYMLHS